MSLISETKQILNGGDQSLWDHLPLKSCSLRPSEELLAKRQLLAHGPFAKGSLFDYYDFAARSFLDDPWSLHGTPKRFRKAIIARALALSEKDPVKTHQWRFSQQHLTTVPASLFLDHKMASLILKDQRYPLEKHLTKRFSQLKAYYLSRLGITELKAKDELALQIILNRSLAPYADRYDPRPLALLFFPTEDWNRAFEGDAADIEKQFQQGYRRLYFEPNDKYTLKKNILDATARLKASFVVFGGHGKQKGIRLGSRRRRSSNLPRSHYWLDTSDGSLFAPLKDRFMKGADIVLSSCSAAKGGKDADNILNAVARWYPQTCVHGLKQDGDFFFKSDSTGKLLGVEPIRGRAVVRCPSYNGDAYREYTDLHRITLPPLAFNMDADPSQKEAQLRKALIAGTQLTKLTALYKLAGLIRNRSGVYLAGSKRYGDDVSFLLNALSSADPAVRLNAIDRLSKKDTALYIVAEGPKEQQRAIKLFIQLITKDEVAKTRAVAVTLLSNVLNSHDISSICPRTGTNPFNVIVSALRDRGWLVRRAAVDALASIHDPWIMSLLISRAKTDRHALVRKAAVAALGQLNAKEAKATVTRALKDRHAAVRMEVVRQYGKIKSPRVISVLVSILRKLKKTEPERTIAEQKNILTALARHDTKRATDALLGSLLDPSWKVSTHAMSLLADKREIRAAKLLLGIAHHPENETEGRIEALQALAKILPAHGQKHFAHFIRPLMTLFMGESSASVRQAIVGVLKHSTQQLARETLIRGLLDVNMSVRTTALEALKGIKDRRIDATLLLAYHSVKREADHSHSYFRSLALERIADSQQPRILEGIKRLLRTKDARKLASIVSALSGTRNPHLLPEFIRLTNKKYRGDVRGASLGALRHYNDASPNPRILAVFKRLLRTNESEGLGGFVKELIGAKDPELLPEFIRLSKNDYTSYVNARAIKALLHYNDLRAVRAIFTVPYNVYVRDALRKAVEKLLESKQGRSHFIHVMFLNSGARRTIRYISKEYPWLKKKYPIIRTIAQLGM